MNKVIIYKQPTGVLSVIYPCYEAKRQILVSEDVFQEIIVPATETDPEFSLS